MAWRFLVLRVKKRTANMEGEKVKLTLEESTKIQRYSSTLSLTWRWMGWLVNRFISGKETRYPLYSKLDGPQARCGRVRKNSPHRDWITGPSSPYSQSLYCTVPAHQIWRVAVNICKQSRIVDKGWSSSLEVERGANKLLSVKKKKIYKMFDKTSD